MSFRVIYEEKAIGQAAGFLADDPAGLGAVLDAAGRLAGDPRPAESFRAGRRTCGGCGSPVAGDV